MQFEHAVLRPPGEGPFPTVVALHGHGAHALDLLGLSQVLPGGLLWLCPQAEHPVEGIPGFTWFHFDRDDPERRAEMERVVERLSAFVEQASERYAIDRERTLLLGFSQGGMLGYRLALSQPARFAGLAALSTTLPAGDDGASDDVAALRRLPVLVQHGTRDPMITVARARESRDRLQALGIDPEYREYEMAHQIGNQSTRDLGEWLGRVLRL